MNSPPSESAGVPAPKVFISYRRQETAAYAGRLFDAVAPRFGERNVFMDVDLEPGIDFVERITEAVGACHVLIVVMGPRWATLKNQEGVTRIADPDDFVRLEVGTALRRPDVTVIPVLVSGARMPDPDDLPQDVAPITRRNALDLSDTRWRYDVGRLIRTLEERLAEMTGTHRMDVPAGEPPRATEPSGAVAERAPGVAPTRRRLLVWVLVLAAAGALAALGIVVLGGGSDGGSDEVVGSEGITFEPFTEAKEFTVEKPVGWHAILPVEDEIAVGKRTEFASLNGEAKLHVLQEPPSPPEDRANMALREASADPGYQEIKDPEFHTFGPRETVEFAYQFDREGFGPVTVLGYAFNAGGSGWRTRAAVPKSDNSLETANKIATEAAKTLTPR